MITINKKHKYIYSQGCHLTVSNEQLKTSEKNKAISNQRLFLKHKTVSKAKRENPNKNWCKKSGTFFKISNGGITG
jgi:hypothetical protein